MKLRREKSCWQQDISRKSYVIAIVKGALLLIIVACLFYDSFLSMVFLLPLLAGYLYFWEKEEIERQKAAFRLQFKDAMLSMNSALNIGYSVENAMREVRKDLAILYNPQTRIMQEFLYMIHELDMNIPVETSLEDFAGRVKQEDVENFVAVFVTAKRVGGDSISIIQNSIQIICDKVEVHREIQTLMSAKVFEFKVMAVIPFGIIFYMRISFPEFLGSLYGNFVGRLIMSSCLVLYLLAYVLGKRIVDIEV